MNDISNITGYRADGAITDVVKLGYLRPILRSWIFRLAEQDKTIFNDKNEFESLVHQLESEINDLNMWFTGLQVEKIFTYINKDFLSGNEAKYSPNNKSQSLAKVLTRFNHLDLASPKYLQTDIYNEYLRSLSLWR